MADVLVVGGGSAECVLAERLSEDPGCEVTLPEAGPIMIAERVASWIAAEGDGP